MTKMTWKSQINTKLLASALGGSLVLVSAPVLAADEANPATVYDGEIIVTARQRNETLLEVPVAVSAISRESLDRQGITDPRELVKLAPSLTIDKSSSGAGGLISLRGIGTSPNNAGFDQAVSVNIDGIQTGRARIIDLGMLDVGQVQVLKGPQALFFGKNSPAGVINITSARPTRSLEGYVRGGYEFVADEYVVEGVVSGPVSNALSARLAVRYNDMKGWLRNRTGTITTADWPYAGPTNLPVPPKSTRPGADDFLARGTLLFEPDGSPFDAQLTVGGMVHHDDGPARGQQVFNCGAFAKPSSSYNFGAGFPYVPDPYGDCQLDRNYTDGGLPNGYVDNWPFARQYPFSTVKMLLASLAAHYDFDNLKLTSVTGYFGSKTSYLDNYDGTSFMAYIAAENEKYSAFSQEFRLLSDFEGPLNFLIGAYYQSTNLDFTNTVLIAPLPVDAATGKYHSWEKPGATDGKTLSAFGQLVWNITPQLELAGGVRYTHEKKDSTLVNSYVHPFVAAALAPQGKVFADNFRDSNYSPEITLTYRPNQDFTTYIGYKTGYKSGGFGVSTNLVPSSITVDDIRFKPETIKGFEGGVKARLLDQMLIITSSIYSYDYKNLQVTSFDPATTSFKIRNAAAAKIKGVEIEFNAKLSRWFLVMGGISYNHARYADYTAPCWTGQTAELGCNTTNNTQQLQGKPLSRAPDWTANIGFDAQVPVGEGFVIGLNGNARFSDDYLATDVYNPYGIQNSFWLLDAAIHFGPADKSWDLALIGKNLGNEYYTSYGVEKPGAPSTTPGTTVQLMGLAARGRQVQVQGTFRF